MRVRDETKSWKKRLRSWDCVILEGREAGRKEEKGEDNWHVEEDGRLTHCCAEGKSNLYIWNTPGSAWKWDQTCIETQKGRQRRESFYPSSCLSFPLSPQRRNRSLSVSVLLDSYSFWTKDGEEAKMKSKGCFWNLRLRGQITSSRVSLCPIGGVLTSEGFGEVGVGGVGKGESGR